MSNSLFTQVINTYELTIVLANLLSRQDLVRLGRTSRRCFAITTGFVWQEVWGVHNLFVLVPGTTCTKKGGGDGWNLSLPSPNTADLTRFKHYVPYVTSLHILPKPRTGYQFSDWKTLSEYAEKGTLLPNLESIAYESDNIKDDVFIRWITPFLSDKVIGVYTHSVEWRYEAMMSMRRAATLLKAVSERCTDITDLSFFPIDPYPWNSSLINEDKDENKLGTREPLSFYDYLGRMHRLRNLTTTSFIISSEEIEVLASLPNLEKVNLYCNFFNEYLDYQLSPKYPEHPFRSLRALELLLPDMRCISQVWSLAPLVRKLTEVTIHLQASDGYDNDDHFSDDEFAYTRNIIAFIPELCKRSPNIRKLIIDFDATRGSFRQVVSLETLRSLVTLPLETLDLRHAALDNVPQACRVLGQSSTLRNLHLQDQKVTYEHLALFSQIPRLELFHAEIVWSDVQGLQKLQGAVRPRTSDIMFLHCSIGLQNQQVLTDSNVLRNLMQFLCLRFLKLEELAWVGTSMYGVGPGVTDMVCAQFTQMYKDTINGLRKKYGLARSM
ncbi:hypothetical protein FRC12_022426 [Ceratobasidium sp. 428]|nr:hypothetical protein FRC12_022426 [Ceratobasidium sp. 428]